MTEKLLRIQKINLESEKNSTNVKTNSKNKQELF